MIPSALLQEILAYVDLNIKNNISIGDISKRVNYSTYFISRTFSELTGMSPMRYVTLRKLQFAAYELSKGKKIIDVAFEFGFDTPEGFTKAFRNCFGYSPSKYPLYEKINEPKKIDIKTLRDTFGGGIMTSQPVQKGAIKNLLTITEHGVRKKEKFKIPGHAMGFPALMSSLKLFLGLPVRMEPCDREPYKAFLWDLDYYFHLAVSTEGFGLFYDLPQAVIANNLWDGEPLKDCFNAEGIQYRLFAEDTVTSKDELLNIDIIDFLILEQLKKDLPVIIFYKANLYLFVTGICEKSMQLLAYPFADGSLGNKAYEIQKNSRLYQNWKNDIGAVILIDGVCEPCSRKEVIIRALKRGHEMLTETEPTYFDYGYGDNLYKNWIKLLENNNNFKTKKDRKRFISPEDVDMAERRAFTAEFFLEAEKYVSEGKLKDAYDSFSQIHNNMMSIQGLTSRENERKLLDSDTRKQIISILNECKELDHIAANCIKRLFTC